MQRRLQGDRLTRDAMKNNLILGLYCKDLRSACMASLETENGLETGVIRWAGTGIASALQQILQDAQPLNAKRLTILCNHPGLVSAFTKPVRLALPDVRKEGKKQIPCGNEHQWAVARALCRYESWRIVYLENLPKSKELWNEHFGTIETSGH